MTKKKKTRTFTLSGESKHCSEAKMSNNLSSNEQHLFRILKNNIFFLCLSLCQSTFLSLYKWNYRIRKKSLLYSYDSLLDQICKGWESVQEAIKSQGFVKNLSKEREKNILA